MLSRRHFLTAAIALAGSAAIGGAGEAYAQATPPSAARIEQELQAAPRKRLAPQERVTVQELRRRPEIRRIAPSIDIQSINFEFGSAEIPYSQYGKVENIAVAMKRILRRNRNEVFLIEGHTDAVGSFSSNQILSERRAESLREAAGLEPVRYEEAPLLVPPPSKNRHPRRVTLRRVTDVVRPF